MVMGSGIYGDPELSPEELWKDDPDYLYVMTGRVEPEDDFTLMRRWTNLLHSDSGAFYREMMRRQLTRAKAIKRRLQLEDRLQRGEMVDRDEYMRCALDTQEPLALSVDGEKEEAGNAAKEKEESGETENSRKDTKRTIYQRENTYVTETGEVNDISNVVCGGQNFDGDDAPAFPNENEGGREADVAGAGATERQVSSSSRPQFVEQVVWHRDLDTDEKDSLAADWRLEFVQHLKRLSPLTAWTNMQAPNMMELLAMDLAQSERKSLLSPADPRSRDSDLRRGGLGLDYAGYC
ncbi:unnamed protein product [Amoebophrya sp. A25]|nr:unnamed protein product [Amoebophrya sp. A25]|eukprot:GSA25T00018830001.1